MKSKVEDRQIAGYQKSTQNVEKLPKTIEKLPSGVHFVQF